MKQVRAILGFKVNLHISVVKRNCKEKNTCPGKTQEDCPAYISYALLSGRSLRPCTELTSDNFRTKKFLIKITPDDISTKPNGVLLRRQKCLRFFCVRPTYKSCSEQKVSKCPPTFPFVSFLSSLICFISFRAYKAEKLKCGRDTCCKLPLSFRLMPQMVTTDHANQQGNQLKSGCQATSQCCSLSKNLQWFVNCYEQQNRLY